MNKLLQKYFGFDPATTTIRTEIIAGVSTFLTMAYILAVNPAILGITGMDKGALFATTAITSGIATLIMALYAKMPFGDTGYKLEYIMRNIDMVKNYSRFLDIELGFWNYFGREYEDKVSPSDMGKEQMRNILANEITMIGDEDDEDEL